MKKSTLAIAAAIALSAASLSALATTAAGTPHYGAPHKAGTALTAAAADNFDVVNHDQYNSYTVRFPGSGSFNLDPNPYPNQPDPPSCPTCQISDHINSWPTTIFVNGYSYSIPKAGPITYFDIYPPSNVKGKSAAMTKSNLKPRVVIHQ